MTTYLKFDTQADCVAAFAPYLVTDQTGDSHMPFYIGMSAVDVVGVIHKPTGEYTTTEDGFRIPVTQALDGWHVNMSGSIEDCPPDLQPFAISPPATPSRVFA
jgi:hypothetical protein